MSNLKKVEISKKALATDSTLYWNSFNELLSNSEIAYDKNMGLLADCRIIYWYASFFANGGVYYALDLIPQDSYGPLIDALGKFGAKEHAKIVVEMKDLYLKSEQLIANDLESDEIDSSIENIEKQGYDCKQDLFELLGRIQIENEEKLVVWCE